MEENCEALEGADALLLLSEWALFRRLDFPRMKDLLKTPLIFDGRMRVPRMMLRCYLRTRSEKAAFRGVLGARGARLAKLVET